MRERNNASKALLLFVGIIVLTSLFLTESQAFAPNQGRSTRRVTFLGSISSKAVRNGSKQYHPQGGVNNNNNSGGRIGIGGGGGNGGGGNRIPPSNNNNNGDGDSERPENQSIPWGLVGASVLSKTLEGGNEAAAAATTAYQAAALSVSTVIPSTSSKFSWQRVLSVMLVLTQALRGGGNPVQFLSSGARQTMSWYLLQLTNHPVLTKAITAGVVGFFGDYLAQWLEYSLGHRGHGRDDGTFLQRRLLIRGTYDLRRSLGILVHGIIVTGPLMHWGYGLFEHFIPTTPSAIVAGKAASQSLAAISHVLADSTVLDGIFIASTFLVTGIMEGIKTDELLVQFRNDYFPSLKASLAASLTLAPLEFAYFRFLPVPLRPLFMNLNDIVWDAVISFMAHRSRHHLPPVPAITV